MEQKVRVREIRNDGTAVVLHVRESACSGDCHQCSGCGAARESILLTAENPIGARVGDLVTISSASGPVLKAAAVLYLLPVALFFLGYALGALWLKAGGLLGCLGFAAGIGSTVLYDRAVTKKQKTIYTITGFAEDPLLRSVKKGDNSLD